MNSTLLVASGEEASSCALTCDLEGLRDEMFLACTDTEGLTFAKDRRIHHAVFIGLKLPPAWMASTSGTGVWLC